MDCRGLDCVRPRPQRGILGGVQSLLSAFPAFPSLVTLAPERLLDPVALGGSAVLVVIAVLAAYGQELSTLLAARLIGSDDSRLELLARLSLRQSATWWGWLVLPVSLALLLQIGVVVPVWAFSRRLLDAPLATPKERRAWLVVQMMIVPVLLFAAATFSMIIGVLPTRMAVYAPVIAVLATAMKQCIILALLHFVPIPPFGLGRSLPWLWKHVRVTRVIQGIVLTLILVDGLMGGRFVGRTVGTVADLFVASLRLLS